MTFETYEKAQDLRSKMDYISNLENIIHNAAQGSAIAAVKDIGYADDQGILVETYKVSNHIYLTEEFAKKFLDVLKDEYEKTLEEFNKL